MTPSTIPLNRFSQSRTFGHPNESGVKTILLFGAPGSGKGTVGRALGAVPGFMHVACGDIFRNLDYTSPLGQEFVRYSAQGLLVPDDTTVALWKDAIEGYIATHVFNPVRDTLVLDGIPRNVAQAVMMEPYIDVRRVFYLVCSDENLMFERLRRRALHENRLDDASEDVIRRRWHVYEEESRPILEYYPAESVVAVDAIGKPLKVIHSVLGHLLDADEQAARQSDTMQTAA